MSSNIMPPPTGHIIDTGAALAIVGTILGYLPALAALAAIVWYAIQIYESRSVQHWIANRAMKKAAAKLLRLKSQQKVLEAEITASEKLRVAKKEARDVLETARAEAVIAEAVAAPSVPDTASEAPGQPSASREDTPSH